jgi:hypothetical protein
MLKDEQIQLIIQLRVEDISSVTRESALDIIHRNLGNLIAISEEDKKFDIQKYVNMVINRAQNDTNLSVRKKVIMILTQILDHTSFESLKPTIIKLLISKWTDKSSLNQMRSSLVNSLQKILKQKKISILFEIIEQCLQENFCSINQKAILSNQLKNINEQNDLLIIEIFSEVMKTSY